MRFSIGLTPKNLDCRVADQHLHLESNATHQFSDLKLTVSYENSDGEYLDFTEIDCDAIEAGQSLTIALELAPLKDAVAATIDVSGTEQTFLKRHWKLLSTIVAVGWGLIIVARRLAP